MTFDEFWALTDPEDERTIYLNNGGTTTFRIEVTILGPCTLTPNLFFYKNLRTGDTKRAAYAYIKDMV